MAANRRSLSSLLTDQDFLSGIMFVAFGGAARYLSYNYPLGTFMSPGSGAFPMLLSYGLVLIGMSLVVKAVFVEGTPSLPWNMWALGLVTAAIISFEFLIDTAGLVVSMVSLIVLAALAGREARPKELAIFALVLIVGSVGLFILGLGLPVKVLPWT